MGHGVKGRDFYLRNIVYSRLSSFEIGIWPGVKQSISVFPRRLKNFTTFWVPFAIADYLLIDWMDKENALSHRKNPKDFENDV